MGALQKIVRTHNIQDEEGFAAAMKEAARVSEGELRFFLTYDPGGQSHEFRLQLALARAELDRRSFHGQKRLARVAGYFGLAGVIVGAMLQVIANLVLQDPDRGLAMVRCPAGSAAIGGAGPCEGVEGFAGSPPR